MAASEDDLMKEITAVLERHGYLPRLRASLKVTALRKAQELVAEGTLPATPAIAAKQFAGNDALMIELCRNLFRCCRLEQTEQMLRLEADAGADLAAAFPDLNPDDKIPVLSDLIARAQPG
jgi:hypothetical protein